MRSVSVIIPTFNRKEQLRHALDSVLEQNDADYEVIVVDDGSADGTNEMIQDEYPDIQYYFQENAGPASARNTGISKAAHEWLAFLDSDDIWLPDKLKTQAAFFLNESAYKICQTEEIWIRNGKRVNPMHKHKKPAGLIYEACLKLCLISPSSVMLHRSILEDVGLFDEFYPACEDYELWLRITSKYPVGKIEQPHVFKYGGHADQLSKEFPAMDRFRILALVKILLAKTLSPVQEESTLRELREKIRVYLLGAQKRNKKNEVKALESLYHNDFLTDKLPELDDFFRNINPG